MVENVTGLDDLTKEQEAREKGRRKAKGRIPPLPPPPPFLQTAISIEYIFILFLLFHSALPTRLETVQWILFRCFH